MFSLSNNWKPFKSENPDELNDRPILRPCPPNAGDQKRGRPSEHRICPLNNRLAVQMKDFVYL